MFSSNELILFITILKINTHYEILIINNFIEGISHHQSDSDYLLCLKIFITLMHLWTSCPVL